MAKICPSCQSIRTIKKSAFPSGAGEGIRSLLQNLFNNNSEEAKLLATQLSILNNYLGGFDISFPVNSF